MEISELCHGVWYAILALKGITGKVHFSVLLLAGNRSNDCNTQKAKFTDSCNV